MQHKCILLCCLIVLFTIPIQCQREVYPAIAMNCGKNTQHRDLVTGEWISDSTGNKDCMKSDTDILAYCKHVYPDLMFTTVNKDSSRTKIKTWCALGHRSQTCKGHAHSVYLYKCLKKSADLPPLDVKPGCILRKLKNKIQCQESSLWLDTARETCQDFGKVISEERRPVSPCADGKLYHGFEFVCCPGQNVDAGSDVCTLTKKTGLCRAAFHMWYFNMKTKSCDDFIYGGCGGNGNRFKSEKDCLANCSHLVSKTPLLNMGFGPVIPEEAPGKIILPKKKEINESRDSYISSPLNPLDEQRQYADALFNEAKEHQNKLAATMKQWSSAKSNFHHRGASLAERKQLDTDLQATVDALNNEHQKKKEQLTSAHQARTEAAIVGAREKSYNDLTQKLNNPDVTNKQLLSAFKKYLQTEKRDQHHTNNLLQSKNVEDATSATLQAKLQSIKERVNNVAELARGKLGSSQASSKLDDMVSKWLGSSPSSPSFTTTALPEVDPYDEPVLIDHGGLAPENTDYRESIPSYHDKDDYVMEDEGDEFSDETPPPLLPSDFDMNNPPIEKDPLNTYSETDDMDDAYNKWNDDDDEWDDDEPSPSFVIRRAGSYNERWLIWLGVGGAVVFFALFGVAVAYYVRTRINKTRQFARVEIDDHLTPEERQLLTMQQNGYENPTYKFFEKQQRA